MTDLHVQGGKINLPIISRTVSGLNGVHVPNRINFKLIFFLNTDGCINKFNDVNTCSIMYQFITLTCSEMHNKK